MTTASASRNTLKNQEMYLHDELAGNVIHPETAKLDTIEVEERIDALLTSFDIERQVEKRFMRGFGQSISARKKLLELNLGMVADIVEYADYKSSNMWKHRFKKPSDELNLFQTTTKAMARHLYILENFRQAEIDRLLVKASLHYKEGFEAKNSMNRGLLKAIANEAAKCKVREKEVSEAYKELMKRMSGEAQEVKKKKNIFRKKKAENPNEGDPGYQTWEESTQRAKLLEAQTLRVEAEEAVYLKYHELTKNSMLEFESIYARIILIEIEFHSKALEELTGAFQCLQCPMRSLDELDSRPRLKRLIEEKKITTRSCKKLTGNDSDEQCGKTLSEANLGVLGKTRPNRPNSFVERDYRKPSFNIEISNTESESEDSEDSDSEESDSKKGKQETKSATKQRRSGKYNTSRERKSENKSRKDDSKQRSSSQKQRYNDDETSRSRRPPSSRSNQESKRKRAPPARRQNIGSDDEDFAGEENGNSVTERYGSDGGRLTREQKRSRERSNRQRQESNRSREEPNNSRQASNRPREGPDNSRQEPNRSRERPDNSRQTSNRPREGTNSSRQEPNRSREGPDSSRLASNRPREGPDSSRQEPDRSREGPDRSRQMWEENINKLTERYGLEADGSTRDSFRQRQASSRPRHDSVGGENVNRLPERNGPEPEAYGSTRESNRPRHESSRSREEFNRPRHDFVGDENVNVLPERDVSEEDSLTRGSNKPRQASSRSRQGSVVEENSNRLPERDGSEIDSVTRESNRSGEEYSRPRKSTDQVDQFDSFESTE